MKSPPAPARGLRSASPDNLGVDRLHARQLRRAAAFVLTLTLSAVIVAAWFLGLVSWETHEGYFDPAFSPDGRYVYTVARQTTGVTWGPGWEFFSPPAHAWLIADRVRLARIDVASARVEVLEEWPATPLVRRTIREYRGRIFATMRARV